MLDFPSVTTFVTHSSEPSLSALSDVQSIDYLVILFNFLWNIVSHGTVSFSMGSSHLAQPLAVPQGPTLSLSNAVFRFALSCPDLYDMGQASSL